MNPPRHCPAVLIAAPASGQGKTTVTAALARLHRNLGRKVRVFKCGPDFLDPMIHERASGAPVYQLDMWMVGEQESRRLLWEAAGEADLILIEGVMGLFDGTPSSADLARHFGVPVLAVIDGTAMAQTFGALALGLARYQADLPFAGVLANRVGTVRHAQLLEGSLTEGLRWYGALSRETGIELPSRHLGLVQASELNDLDLRLDAAAAWGAGSWSASRAFSRVMAATTVGGGVLAVTASPWRSSRKRSPTTCSPSTFAPACRRQASAASARTRSGGPSACWVRRAMTWPTAT